MKYYISELKYLINEKLTNDLSFNESLMQSLKNDGIAVFPNYLDQVICDRLINDVNTMIEKGIISWSDNKESDIRIMGIENKVDYANKIFETEILDKLYKHYIDKKSLKGFVMCNRLTYREGNKGSGGGWHRDVINRRQLKFMVYLNDVGLNNGCFQYIKGSHKPNKKYQINKLLNLPTAEYRYSEENITKLQDKSFYKITNFNANAGDLIIFDSSGIHRGKPIEDGIRYAATKYMWDTNIPNHIQKLII